MNEHQKAYLLLWLLTCLIVLSIVAAVTFYNCYAIAKYTEHGYEEQVFSNGQSTHWVKSPK